MRSREIYIIAGHNGSGKTTLARELLKETAMPFLNADEIAEDISPGDVGSARIKAGKAFFIKMTGLIKQRRSFALESTLSGRYLIRVIRSLRAKKYRIRIAYIFLDSSEMAIERIKVRVQSGGHHIPDIDVRRRFRRSMDNFWTTYRMIADEWELYYNGGTIFTQIAFGEKNKYTVIDESMFSSFSKGIEL